jgi:hypothetical protein
VIDRSAGSTRTFHTDLLSVVNCLFLVPFFPIYVFNNQGWENTEQNVYAMILASCWLGRRPLAPLPGMLAVGCGSLGRLDPELFELLHPLGVEVAFLVQALVRVRAWPE